MKIEHRVERVYWVTLYNIVYVLLFYSFFRLRSVRVSGTTETNVVELNNFEKILIVCERDQPN